MARKKKTSKKAQPEKKPKADLSSLPDLRSIEGMMADFFPGPRRGAVDRAQDIMYDAWGAGTRKQVITLAKKALKVSPDCADAYVLLAAETARSVDEAIELYSKGVEAGKRALGKERFKKYEGDFWGFIETRPYMRARCGLARSLWEAGRHEEAVEHYWEMLRLNPNENQGIRDLLMPCLIQLGRNKDAEKLYRQYRGDGMAVWRFSRALLDFRESGDSAAAKKSLKAALAENKHVPAYLLGHKKMPRYIPDHYGFGDDNESVLYADGSKAVWRATPGALDWLRATVT